MSVPNVLNKSNTVTGGPGQQNSNGSPNNPQMQRIFVQRDYRLGVAIRFCSDFPQELNGRVS